MDDIDLLIEKVKNAQIIPEDEVKILCEKVKEILIGEPNVQRLNSPITICGDIHGQFNDLIELFGLGGECPYTNYLFLGDLVNRGRYSIETLLLLFALKVKYPDCISIIRGNHESREITQFFGLYDECLYKYGTTIVWKYCCDVFNYLSLVAVIDNTIFCVHGGLSPELQTIDQINEIQRNQEIPHFGPMCDLLWSDPDTDMNGFSQSPRGAGYLFGSDIVKNFNHLNSVGLIVRAHQLVMEGYKYIFNNTLVTIWSAPNYCYRMGNSAAILELDENLNISIKTFEAGPFKVGPENKNLVPDYFL